MVRDQQLQNLTTGFHCCMQIEQGSSTKQLADDAVSDGSSKQESKGLS